MVLPHASIVGRHVADFAPPDPRYSKDKCPVSDVELLLTILQPYVKSLCLRQLPFRLELGILFRGLPKCVNSICSHNLENVQEVGRALATSPS